MLWLGCGVSLTALAVAAMWTGEVRGGWFNAVVAAIMAIGCFATASLANLPWLRIVAVAWWFGELALFGLRHDAEALPVASGLMLVLLAGPGLVLLRRSGRPAAE
jgi:hypothetical protein